MSTRCDDSGNGGRLGELKLALAGLSAVASPESKHGVEELKFILRRVERALPSVCTILEASNDVPALVDACELLALISPSRRGLQPIIVEGGIVPALVRLLGASTRPAPQPHALLGLDAHGPCSFFSIVEDGHEDGSTERAGAPASGGRTSPNPGTDAGLLSGPSATYILSHVLRTLVNLTSTAKIGTSVRQAILHDDWAVAALLRLLMVETEPDFPTASGDLHSAVMTGADTSAVGLSRGAAAGEVSWQLAGLAAWLVAHLCSTPTGQLQLVQEGIVPRLVNVIRQGRMTWTAALTAAAAEGGVAAAAASCAEAAGDPQTPGSAAAASCASDVQDQFTNCSGGQHVRRRAVSGVLPLPHGSSALLCDAAAAAAAAAGGGVDGPALPFVLAAMQYALMALVNITFDNSANQRTAAVAGVLTELDMLFGELLQPGVLTETRGSGSRPPMAAASVQAPGGVVAARAETAAADRAAGSSMGMGYGHVEETIPEGDRQQLLRTCCQGVAKFAVWLLAHLSSSDPDLKAAITGPGYNFVPRLLTFLMFREEDLEGNQSKAAPTAGGARSPPSAAAGPSIVFVRQYAGMALVNLTCGVPSTKTAVAGAMDWAAMAAMLQWLADVALQPASPTVASVGIPSASPGPESGSQAAGVAAPAPAHAPAPQQHPGTPAAHPPPATTAVTTGAQAPASTAATSDLLLYTVWLLQHLSLSPHAAANADPRVISPLVALLGAPEPHVRLRAAAALGALCSAAVPPKGGFASSSTPTASPGPAGVVCGGSHAACQGTPHGRNRGLLGAGAQVDAHPHRAAFLEAGGVQQLLAAAQAERDPHLLAYDMLCLSSSVGEDNVVAVAQAVAGGALELLEGLLASEHAACLIPAAEALQALARAARNGLRRYYSSSAGEQRQQSDAQASAAAVSAAADHVPRSLLSRVVAVMLTHSDPRVRVAMNDALGALTSLPGVREGYCAVFAETLQELVNSAEVELRVIPVN